MVFNATTAVVNDPRASERKIWEGKAGRSIAWHACPAWDAAHVAIFTEPTSATDVKRPERPCEAHAPRGGMR